MMTYNKDANLSTGKDVNDRIREQAQGIRSVTILGLRNNIRIRNKISCGAIELFQKPIGDYVTRILEVVVAGIFEIFFRARVKLKTH